MNEDTATRSTTQPRPTADLELPGQQPGQQPTRSNQTSHLEDGYQLIELGWRSRKGSQLG
ncbi:hypothetical protein [Propionimicrobium lymphophilum]|uniref:hypothetical protein n=1 Tax=Propionimicrobium lymphophilum TaxID=33012 RepID=UPI0023F49FFB|nr:hypothetical protein [Propionimicrobium lymphophilum]